MDLSVFVGKRIAIDTTLKVHELFAAGGANPDRFEGDMIRFMERLKVLEVEPRFVFDGQTKGLKQRAHTARAQARVAGAVRLQGMKEEIDRCLAAAPAMAAALMSTSATPTPTPTPTPSLTPDAEAGAKVVDEKAVPVSPVPYAPTIEDVRTLQEKYVRVKAQLTAPSRDVFAVAKDVIKKAYGPDSVVHAEDDAEREVARLCASGAVDFAVSNDYDTLVFGSPNLVMWFLHPVKMVMLESKTVLAGLGFATRAQFVDFAILAGCDFCEKVPGVGVVTAHKYILDHGTIEAAWDRVMVPKLPPGHVVDFDFARRRFLANDIATVTVSTPAPEPEPEPKPEPEPATS